MTTAMWWIRRDLRLSDNQALGAALAHGEQVLPVFILDPELTASRFVGDKRMGFLLEGLRLLDADLQRRGSRLTVRHGAPEEELAYLLSQSGADAIFAEEDYSPFARRRDVRVAQELPLHLVDGVVLHPPGSILKSDGTPYTVFTPFSRRWREQTAVPTNAILPPPSQIRTPGEVLGETVPQRPELSPGVTFRPGEAEAQRLLAAFVDGADAPVNRYGDTRNRLDQAGTSQLSPYLRFGMLSARQAIVSALASVDAALDGPAHKSAVTWLNELIWREFYVHILYHFPHVRTGSFRAQYQNLAWENDRAAFSAWCEGRTGYPVVDAAMRQLRETGWRWGEQWFMQQLIDGDPAANNGGWQWTAGTGTDAAPYFRIFNPLLQSEKHDPDGAFIRRWVPELMHVPSEYIHEPWRMPGDVQQASGCIIGHDYVAPIVDHGEMRERALDLFRQAKEEHSSATS
jgi:deoxyribodipyrimidine photo-lyase